MSSGGCSLVWVIVFVVCDSLSLGSGFFVFFI